MKHVLSNKLKPDVAVGVTGTPASYSVEPLFKYRPGDRLSSLMSFAVFLFFSRQILLIVP
jgi:hypothetical protein